MRALISVSDKSRLEIFARELISLGYEIISTGGTYQFLTSRGIPATKVEEITRYPEILNGRVKTLHPVIHGGILAKNENDVKELGLKTIDMVVVNLYPFKDFVNASEEKMIENIDIGGVALLRAAAKNYQRVIVVSSPEQYNEVIALLKEGKFDIEERRRYAMRAFALTASYDSLIYNTLWRRFSSELPDFFIYAAKKLEDLRYGENPHQRGAIYANKQSFIQHHGKKLSFNNIYDLDGAWDLVTEFEEPAAAVIKHSNPCGAAIAKNLKDAFIKAWNSDSMSAYGSVVAFNGTVDTEVAREFKGKFVEIIAAPSFTPEALKILQKKKNLRILEMFNFPNERYRIKHTNFGILLQDVDTKKLENYEVVTKRVPTEKEMQDLIFAWYVVRHVKSNAIVFVKDRATVGIGAGQMSRVDSVKIAAMKAGDRAKGAVLASDAFFPFRDDVDEAHHAGITAIIQPGGSIRDKEVIEAANEHNMAMIFTHYRVFRH